MQIGSKNLCTTLSFKALYTITSQENPDKIDDIINLKEKYPQQKGSICAYTEKAEDNCDCSTVYFLGENYDADDEIETMLLNKGIKFKRTSFAKLLNSAESIKRRVVLSPEEKTRGFHLVEIDRIKFDAKYEFFGYEYIGNGLTGINEPQKTEKFENYLKTGKKIYAPVVFINNNGKYPEIIFEDGRHRYAYMRDIKMSGIPVAMNEESVKIAEKFGLLKQ